MKIRQDAWSSEDDLLLAETVLRHIREGGTQLKAFDEVGDELNRTSAACGFRWNAVVRNQYNEAIKLAKKQRKEMKRRLSYKPTATVHTMETSMMPTMTASEVNVVGNYQQQTQSLNLKDVLNFIQSLASKEGSSLELRKDNEKLMKENLQLMTEKKELEAKLSKLENDHRVVEEDYQSLIQIMNRARRMALLQDEEEQIQAPKFRMDKNGNLEKIAK
ncbi:RsfA family transcriptional regulator [Anaerobacillus isosaccharinicus]|uniref:Transcriptional regulator n=1 Tax=Anaerobacillus isosaccharinicus TaxID=1532552 RepID=A0A1S2LG86_9BACI|nr:RsfA family transcriptional regulator [Anaerobacillus isosaccharinicus]MBA5585381.1 RsfA family transcriptional regulator [Anaerobacillus isosaccharinicus]QOY36299.1 RsfA family transcriptional regulator [Anaerobacillus isosaccharinicus]